MKRCKCGVEHDRSHPYCSDCQREYNRVWRAAHPDKVKQWIANWKKKNPERRAELNRKSDRKRYWERHEHIRAAKLAQWKANPSAARARYPLIPQERKRANWRIHELVRSGRIQKPSICQTCGGRGQRIEAHHPDHGKPESIVWLCSRCHGATRRKEQTI